MFTGRLKVSEMGFWGSPGGPGSCGGFAGDGMWPPV